MQGNCEPCTYKTPVLSFFASLLGFTPKSKLSIQTLFDSKSTCKFWKRTWNYGSNQTSISNAIRRWQVTSTFTILLTFRTLNNSINTGSTKPAISGLKIMTDSEFFSIASDNCVGQIFYLESMFMQISFFHWMNHSHLWKLLIEVVTRTTGSVQYPTIILEQN